jgi:hypothetical protein
MTYLELVNNVLRRLRETEVSTINQTTYSTMVGDFVNDAKELVEARHNWSANRQELEIVTLEDTRIYSLTGFGQNGDLLTHYNDTNNTELKKVSQHWMDHKNNTQEVPVGTVEYFTFRGLDSNKDAQIEVWPNPSTGQVLNFYFEKSQSLLVNEADVVNIPHLPIIHLAVAMLAEEKGEAGGTQSARYFRMADRYLADAIMGDIEKNREEWIWREV